jgi:hypothetical protein
MKDEISNVLDQIKDGVSENVALSIDDRLVIKAKVDALKKAMNKNEGGSDDSDDE